jgi:hypothetical protein
VAAQQQQQQQNRVAAQQDQAAAQQAQQGRFAAETALGAPAAVAARGAKEPLLSERAAAKT